MKTKPKEETNQVRYLVVLKNNEPRKIIAGHVVIDECWVAFYANRGDNVALTVINRDQIISIDSEWQ